MREHFSLPGNIKSTCGNLFTMRGNLYAARKYFQVPANFFVGARKLLCPMRGFWASNPFRNAVKPWLDNWSIVGSFGTAGGVSILLIHQLLITTTSSNPTPYCQPPPLSPTLWKATRAHVRPCSCWALMCGAPVEQQWGRSPRHSTTNGHRAATSSPLPSLRDVGDHNGTMMSTPLPSSMTWVHDNEMRWPMNSQQEVDRRSGTSSEVRRPVLPCFPLPRRSSKPSPRRCIATRHLVLHARL